ncbi:MAG: hypothetical protein JWM73_2781 [Solirubrobacterales bacterium]|nr:hypothetical protein [Solirubrobacterales bacterium]
MNEFDLLRALRDADAAPPRPEARTDARRALLGAARQGAPRRSRRPWAMAGAGLATAAAVVVALLTGLDSGRVAPEAARAALERAAVAAEDGALDVGPGQFLYIRERDAYVGNEALATGPSWGVILPQARETWVARDGSGRIVSRAGAVQFPGSRDRKRWEAAGSPDMGHPQLPAEQGDNSHGPSDWPVGDRSLTYEELAALPTDGRAMYDRLISMTGDTGPSPDGEVFVIVGDLLRGAPVPAHIRAALYRATAFIKGIRFAGEVTDALGRRGVAVDMPNEHGSRNRLVFDPNTSALLAEEEVLTERKPWLDADPGFAIGSRVVLETAVVDSDTARPGS